MRNLARAIEERKQLLSLARSNAKRSQCVFLNPFTPEYFNESGHLVIFYKVLNSYFLAGNEAFLQTAYTSYCELEKDGWVISNGRLVNLVFKRCIPRIELIIEAWFYEYAMDLNNEWLRSAISITVDDDVKLLRHDRLLAGIQSTPFPSFKRQIESFSEMRLKELSDKKKADYLEFLNYKVMLEDWDYRNPCKYLGFSMYCTEINVPVIDLDINELIYRLARVLGLDWANKYVTEPTARNAFIKNHGLIL